MLRKQGKINRYPKLFYISSHRVGIASDGLFLCNVVFRMTGKARPFHQVFALTEVSCPHLWALAAVRHMTGAARASLGSGLFPDVFFFRRHPAHIVFCIFNRLLVLVAGLAEQCPSGIRFYQQGPSLFGVMRPMACLADYLPFRSCPAAQLFRSLADIYLFGGNIDRMRAHLCRIFPVARIPVGMADAAELGIVILHNQQFLFRRALYPVARLTYNRRSFLGGACPCLELFKLMGRQFCGLSALKERMHTFLRPKRLINVACKTYC